VGREAWARPGVRAGVSLAYCAALALTVVLYDHPLILAGGLVAPLAAGRAAGAGGEVVRAVRLGLPFALLVLAINPVVSQQGETLLIRGGELFGWRFDVTLEAVAFGGIAALRVLALITIFGLFSACVDPDEMLRLFRRVSYRSALTAALATRLVPLLARDALRMGDAARCRAAAAGRLAVARAALANALDRAVDTAAALEVRGYANAARPRPERRPWSRHDLRVGAATAAIAMLALGARLAGAGAVQEWPRLALPVGPLEAAVAAGLPLLALAPLAGPAGRLGVTRA
jgi:energy-coupling factor transport system permease protein